MTIPPLGSTPQPPERIPETPPATTSSNDETWDSIQKWLQNLTVNMEVYYGAAQIASDYWTKNYPNDPPQTDPNYKVIMSLKSDPTDPNSNISLATDFVNNYPEYALQQPQPYTKQYDPSDPSTDNLQAVLNYLTAHHTVDPTKSPPENDYNFVKNFLLHQIYNLTTFSKGDQGTPGNYCAVFYDLHAATTPYTTETVDELNQDLRQYFYYFIPFSPT